MSHTVFPSPARAPAAPNPDKTALRKRLRQGRNQIPEPVRRFAGHQVERQALRLRLLSRRRRIGFYIPAKGELDCLPLLNRALHMGIACYLPVVPCRRLKKLWFTRLEGEHRWVLNRYGIPEYGPRRPRVRASALDLLFMPLLGFDDRGFRIGMGGGYYDASLAYLGLRRHWHRPRLVGLAFESQHLPHIPEDPWDRPLDAALTESTAYRFRGTG